uniref:ATP-dependent Clp protease proteolytic subunit n=1 Tax=Chamaenerion angustifolium TaxID=13055 RepID=A0A7G9XDR9_9MYRT|nr:ATP-dependent Clp protease proteolytic subunit [Chamaenerion angustifolium]YP_010281129.1 ATP-dependent Clp protease proteolytic subunit [Chamaenerion angustifolium subsp. circumvagum]YP_010281637.1 ATP-dependent Clp protease proteolytic subunit [Chamaenerion conspersum]YP_010281722.1 ATP-dependent Clp protease proteolytic subunit [Chamaenerion angustifolium subsp. angustifolium]QNO33527.1 ATP-dependent Clp protease proteolytic subunit [Chamaenerion angustifolium]UKH50424.1 ATP-dependent Cl
MPIGVPKIPFRIPGDEEASWVDLYNGLYRSRSLFLGQEVDYEIGNHIAGLMIFLSIEDANKDLYFFINSPGGLAVAGLVIYDTMQFVTPHVYTLGLGLAASMGSFLLVGGEITKRLASPNARVMIHQPASSYTAKDPAAEVFVDSEEIEEIREMVLRVYVQRTGKPPGVINDHLERNIFMSATEAKDYGIIDGIGIKDILVRIRDDHPLLDDSPNPATPRELR